MKRPSVIAVLALAVRLAVWAAAPGGGFQPLTPDGYPLAATNSPAVLASATPTPVVSSNVVPSTTPEEINGVVLDDSHKLVPGDKLSFQILEDRHIPNLDNTRPAATSAEQSKALTVADTGELEVPYVGRVNVSGKTCKEVAAELKVLLEKDYYYRATVVLGLDQMSRVLGRVYVWGEVRNQGAVEIPANENLTASKAILRAGGFNDWAKKTKVKIIRAAKPEGGTKQEIYVDMEAVLQEGQTEKDVPLQPDDFIIVPRSKINF
jgi:protein involved in polysaccharide export with SLBB domain